MGKVLEPNELKRLTDETLKTIERVSKKEPAEVRRFVADCFREHDKVKLAI